MLDEARVGIGRIEEVFGPVALPFYALRWAPGPGGAARESPPSLATGALVSVASRLAGHIRPEELVCCVHAHAAACVQAGPGGCRGGKEGGLLCARECR